MELLSVILHDGSCILFLQNSLSARCRVEYEEFVDTCHIWQRRLMAEAYRSRTYRGHLYPPPVLKTGRHTGDETLP